MNLLKAAYCRTFQLFFRIAIPFLPYRSPILLESCADIPERLRASFYAGRAFTKSYGGYCHSVAHSLGGRYNIPHGLANAVLLPHVLEVYGESAHRKLWELACALKLCDESAPMKEGAERMIAMIRRMNAEMDIPETLPGIRREDIPKLADHAEAEANPLYPVPKLMTRGELEQFYYDVMEEEA